MIPESVLYWLAGGGSEAGLIVAFLLAAGLVVGSGIKLSAYGDALGERTGLGSGLVGLLFLSAVTSLPELVVSSTAALAASLKAAEMAPGLMRDLVMSGGADLAIGNMVGSNVFNLMLFAVMDLANGRGGLIFKLNRNHIMSAAAGLCMLGLLLFGIAICNRAWDGTAWVIPVLEIGPVTPVLLATYLFVMFLQQRLEQRDPPGAADADISEADAGLVAMPAMLFYGVLFFCAFLIVLGGMWLSFVGDQMAVTFQLGQSFVGTIFLAISTSLPELVVCIAAVRMGAPNMAAGNILGSNIFNLVIVFTADLALRGGSILHYAGTSHLVTMGMIMILTCIVIIGLIYRSDRDWGWLGYDVWIMVLVYVIGNVALYVTGRPEPHEPGPVPVVEPVDGMEAVVPLRLPSSK